MNNNIPPSNNSIRNNTNESSNGTNRIINFAKNNLLKILIVSAVGYGIYKYHNSPDRNKDTIENNYPFEKEKISYRDDTSFVSNQPISENIKGIKLKRDARLTFYVVQSKDIKIEKYQIEKRKGKGKKKRKIFIDKTRKILNLEGIREKLSNLNEFKHLKRDEYDEKIKGFNVTNDLKPGFLLPIPMNSRNREISPENFANYCYEAIEEIKKNKIYGPEIEELLKHSTEKELIASMLAFARSETTEEYTNFTQPIGVVELHRREPNYNCFSFSYFHILMENNADGSPGPGKKARINLGLTEGECYHPKNAGKLFLGYWIEKTKKHELNKYFPLNNKNIKSTAQKYNGSTAYSKKLLPNYEYCKKLINNEIEKYNNPNLKKAGFAYMGQNSKGKHIYKYNIKEGNAVQNIKKEISKIFNENKDNSCPEISTENIVRENGTAISDKIRLNGGDYIFITST